MAWDAAETSEEIEEANAGDGIGSSTILANPGEKVHIDLERTDTSPSEAWRAAIEVATDPGTRWSDPPIRNRRLKSTQLTPNFVLSGYYGYRVFVENDAVTPSEKVKVMVRYRKDGVNI